LEEDENISLVAWTTTPWTLPSNLAVCVNPDMQYVKIKGKCEPGCLWLILTRQFSIWGKWKLTFLFEVKHSNMFNACYKWLKWFFFFLVVLGLELRAYILSHSTIPFLWGFFWDRVSNVCPVWLRTAILLISASWVARIIGVSHQCPANVMIFKHSLILPLEGENKG
jgi:hypothetical protein